MLGLCLLLVVAGAGTEAAESQPSIGLKVIDARTALDAREKGIPLPVSKEGASVAEVARGGPAAKAGIEPGDIIYRAGKDAIKDASQLGASLATLKPGDSVELAFRRATRTEAGRWSWSTGRKKVSVATEADVQARAEQLGPLQWIGVGMGKDILGSPTVTARLRNRSQTAIIAFEVDIECFDRFDDPVRALGAGSNHYRGISQTTIQPGATKDTTWALHVHGTTTRAKICVDRVKLADKSEWRAQEDAVRITATSKK